MPQSTSASSTTRDRVAIERPRPAPAAASAGARFGRHRARFWRCSRRPAATPRGSRAAFAAAMTASWRARRKNGCGPMRTMGVHVSPANIGCRSDENKPERRRSIERWTRCCPGCTNCEPQPSLRCMRGEACRGDLRHVALSPRELPVDKYYSFTHSPPHIVRQPDILWRKDLAGWPLDLLARAGGRRAQRVDGAGRRHKGREPVTRTKGRPINWQDWSADGRFLMFLNDETGDENHHLFVVDPVTHAMRDVTPLANVSVRTQPVVAGRSGRCRRQDQRPRCALA